MKLIFFKANAGSRHKRKDYGFSFERFLFLLFIASFSLLVLVQAALVNPSIRTFLTSDSEFEGTPLGVEEFFYSEGNISLRLVGDTSNPEIKVLVNGDEVAAFSEPVVDVFVKNGDIVEVDGSSSGVAADVQVIAKSDNILTDCVGKKVNVKSNIRKVTNIKIE